MTVAESQLPMTFGPDTEIVGGTSTFGAANVIVWSDAAPEIRSEDLIFSPRRETEEPGTAVAPDASDTVSVSLLHVHVAPGPKSTFAAATKKKNPQFILP
jgi:hypothetical protein